MKTQLHPLRVGETGKEATQLTSSATGTTGAVAATLAADPARLTWITGFEVTFSNPTAATTVTITVTGTISGTLNYTQQLLAAAATTPPPPPLVVEFPEPIQSSAINQAIAVNVPALGAGATGVSVTAHGFQA